jgi:ABC transport system ATP-binding/permease protein
LPPENIKSVVEKTLAQIEMSDRREVFVHQLSGGQRKRVSIGVELLADPKLFFLDEPTSGLDPGLDKKMMQLLQKLAKEGRTVILVTHATANITLCDRVAFLGRGGHLCYFGIPKEAPRFFNIQTGEFADDFAEIYNELERGIPNVKKWEARFRQSPDYQQYITNHLSSVNGERSDLKTYPQQAHRSPIQQLALLTERYLQLIWRDRVSLGLSLLTAPIGISLITLALRDKDPLILGSEPDATLAPLALRVLFVFTCAAIWVGLSTALQEIIKEAQIYLRERLVNLGLFAYLSSKVVVLGGLAILQTLLITLVILLGFAAPTPDLISWHVGASVTTFLTLLTSLSLGLLVSALVKNSSQANSTLPLLLLPQIIFSGVLFKMEGIASKLSWLMLSRWSVGAYGSLVNVNAMVPEPTKLPDGSTLPQPFETTAVYDPTWENLGLNWGILGVHTLVYLGLTLWIQKRKDIL